MIKRVDVSSRLGSELPQQQENFEEGRMQGKASDAFLRILQRLLRPSRKNRKSSKKQEKEFSMRWRKIKKLPCC